MSSTLLHEKYEKLEKLLKLIIKGGLKFNKIKLRDNVDLIKIYKQNNISNINIKDV